MPIHNYQESLILCKTCIHNGCCGDKHKVENAWAYIAKAGELDRHCFSFQIQCVNFLDAGFVNNAIEAYKNHQEDK